MPSMLCKCGHKLSFGEVPNPIELLVISDVEFDSFQGKVDVEDIYKKMKSVLHCPGCGRLWFFRDGFDSAPISYSLET